MATTRGAALRLSAGIRRSGPSRSLRRSMPVCFGGEVSVCGTGRWCWRWLALSLLWFHCPPAHAMMCVLAGGVAVPVLCEGRAKVLWYAVWHSNCDVVFCEDAAAVRLVERVLERAEHIVAVVQVCSLLSACVSVCVSMQLCSQCDYLLFHIISVTRTFAFCSSV